MKWIIFILFYVFITKQIHHISRILWCWQLMRDILKQLICQYFQYGRLSINVPVLSNSCGSYRHMGCGCTVVVKPLIIKEPLGLSWWSLNCCKALPATCGLSFCWVNLQCAFKFLNPCFSRMDGPPLFGSAKLLSELCLWFHFNKAMLNGKHWRYNPPNALPLWYSVERWAWGNVTILKFMRSVSQSNVFECIYKDNSLKVL